MGHHPLAPALLEGPYNNGAGKRRSFRSRGLGFGFRPISASPTRALEACGAQRAAHSKPELPADRAHRISRVPRSAQRARMQHAVKQGRLTRLTERAL